MAADESPIRAALRPASALRPAVSDGLGALSRADRGRLDKSVRAAFADSLDLDAALMAAHPQERRWDYLLGHDPGAAVIAMEVHSAHSDQVSVVIAKKQAAVDQLGGHLRPGARVAAWIWVSSGAVGFSPLEKAVFRLNQAGIAFAGRTLRSKHLA